MGELRTAEHLIEERQHAVRCPSVPYQCAEGTLEQRHHVERQGTLAPEVHSRVYYFDDVRVLLLLAKPEFVSNRRCLADCSTCRHFRANARPSASRTGRLLQRRPHREFPRPFRCWLRFQKLCSTLAAPS